jgi:methanethiol S-methyltransferase
MDLRNHSPATAAAAFAWGGALLFVCSLAYFLYCYSIVFGRPAPPGPAMLPALVDAGLFSAFALHHSAFARSRFKDWMRRTASPILERSIYTWMASALFIAVCALWQPVPGDAYSLDHPWRWLGRAAQAAGLILTFLGARALDPLDLAGVRAVLVSQGAPQPPLRLVTSGVFTIVRHPLYFGWTLLVFGAPHMTATRLVFAVVSTAYLALAIPWEERGLVNTFGNDYAVYRKQVRWRMLPGLY